MTTVSLSIPGDLRFALPAPVYWLHGSLMQHLLLPVNIQLSKIVPEELRSQDSGDRIRNSDF